MNKKTTCCVRWQVFTLSVVLLGALEPVSAEPTGNPATVTLVRPYNSPSSGIIYFEISSPTPCATTRI